MVLLSDFDVFLKSVFCLPAEQKMLRSRCVIAATLRIAATLSRIPVNLQQTDSHRKSVGFIPTGGAGTQANSTAQTELDSAPKRSATDIE